MDFSIIIADVTGQTFKLDKNSLIVDFLTSEKEFWDSKLEEVKGSPKDAFFKVSTIVDHFINNTSAIFENDKELNQGQINVFNQQAKKIQAWMKQNWIYRGHSFIDPMIKAYCESHDVGKGFHDFCTSKSISFQSQSINKDVFRGYILAANYEALGMSSLDDKADSEREAFGQLKSELTSKKSELIESIDEIKSEFSLWKNEERKRFRRWLNRMSSDSRTWFEYITNKSEQAISGHSRTFNSMADVSRERFSEIEEIFRERTRIEGPASYWGVRAKSLGQQGIMWSIVLIIASWVFALAAGIFFWVWLSKDPIEFGLVSLQGVALFGTLVAIALFLIKTLAKLAFSSFHLQRDAEEREQLAHVYLSLMNEGVLDDKSRDIVLQALFSRAESGLLSGDSGPSMPTPADVIAGISRTARN